MRKERKYNYIYKTTCCITNKYYIGMHSTDDLNDGYIGSGKRLWFSINYHGRDNHSKEILEYCNTREELKKREEEIVNEQLLKEDLCMNLVTGGQGGGGFWSEQHRHNFINSTGPKVFSKKFKEDKKFSEKIRTTLIENIKKAHKNGNVKYDTFTGKKHSEATKKKMSESSKGKGLGDKNSQYGTCWITKGGINKKVKFSELNTFTQSGWVKGRII